MCPAAGRLSCASETPRERPRSGKWDESPWLLRLGQVAAEAHWRANRLALPEHIEVSF